MRRYLCVLVLLIMTVTVMTAAADEIAIIGGADGPTSILLSANGVAEGSLVIPFRANITTGYEWYADVCSGDSAEVDEDLSGYVSDPNPDLLDGVGGTQYFVLNALKPGESMVRFSLSRGPEDEPIDECVMMIVVNDRLQMYAADMDYGSSSVFTREDMNDAVAVIMREFNTWEGCEMLRIAYASDGQCNTENNIAWMNELEKAGGNAVQYTQCMMFESTFRSPAEPDGAWMANEEYVWQWWLARDGSGSWQLMTWGNC